MNAQGTLRIRMVEKRRATLLAAELREYASVAVRACDDHWEVACGAAKTDRLVVLALEAVQRLLDGDPSSDAQVLLDGREYRMYGAPAGRR